MVKRPGPQSTKIVPKTPARLFIAEHMKVRGMEPKDLAAVMGVTEATISRWISAKRGLNQHKQRRLEEVFNLPPGGLAWPPSAAPKESLLAGLDEKKQQQALNFIEFLHKQ